MHEHCISQARERRQQDLRYGKHHERPLWHPLCQLLRRFEPFAEAAGSPQQGLSRWSQASRKPEFVRGSLSHLEQWTQRRLGFPDGLKIRTEREYRCPRYYTSDAAADEHLQSRLFLGLCFAFIGRPGLLTEFVRPEALHLWVNAVCGTSLATQKQQHSMGRTQLKKPGTH